MNNTTLKPKNTETIRVPKTNIDVPLTAKQLLQIDEVEQSLAEEMKPMITALRRSQRLTASDLSKRINTRAIDDEDTIVVF